jgi:hypothetical protein
VKAKLLTLADCRISPSLLGVGGTVVDGEEETRLLETLSPPVPFFVHLQPDQSNNTGQVTIRKNREQ